MEFKDIASVSGKGGLFKILAPTKGGMILESMDESKKKLIVNIHSKVSVLGEISIYTTDKEGAKPLEDVLRTIHKEFNGDTGVSGTSDKEELASFLKFVLPNYDEDRVYMSDIKKIVSWYNILFSGYIELLEATKEEIKTPESKKEEK